MKTILASATLAVLAAFALPASASAHDGHGDHVEFGGFGGYGKGHFDSRPSHFDYHGEHDFRPAQVDYRVETYKVYRPVIKTRVYKKVYVPVYSYGCYGGRCH